MTTRDTPFAAGTPCWVDLLSSDIDKSKTFYGELFGWSSEDAGEAYGGYVTFLSDGRAVGGATANATDSGHPDVWGTYISTEDIDATAAAVTAAGGKILAPPMRVGDLGSMALVMDPV